MTFDCVASAQTIDDGLRFTKAAGMLILVGMPGIPVGIDWTPLWYKELTVHAAYAYGPERPDAIGGLPALSSGMRETFDIAIELMPSLAPKLAALVGTPYELNDFRAAFASAIHTGRSCVVKTSFAISDGKS